MLGNLRNRNSSNLRTFTRATLETVLRATSAINARDTRYPSTMVGPSRLGYFPTQNLSPVPGEFFGLCEILSTTLFLFERLFFYAHEFVFVTDPTTNELCSFALAYTGVDDFPAELPAILQRDFLAAVIPQVFLECCDGFCLWVNSHSTNTESRFLWRNADLNVGVRTPGAEAARVDSSYLLRNANRFDPDPRRAQPSTSSDGPPRYDQDDQVTLQLGRCRN